MSSSSSSPPNSERLERWDKKWESNELGWHKQSVHPFLLKHVQVITSDAETCSSTTTDNKSGISILVPLCGKTVDMAYLAQHNDVELVVGAEGIEKAILEFAQEQPDLEITRHVQDTNNAYPFDEWRGKSIRLLRGDFFDLQKYGIPSETMVDAVWDRASLVAIQPELREQYVDTLLRVMKPGGIILLSILDKRSGTPEGMAAGPPFSVPEKEVRRLFGTHADKIVMLEEVDELEQNEESKARWDSRGISSCFEVLFAIYLSK